MADRLVAVGSDFVLPKEVVVKPVNLPTYLSEDSLSSATETAVNQAATTPGSPLREAITGIAAESGGGGAALVPDPNNPGLYFVAVGGQIEKDEEPGFYRIKGLN